MNGAKHSDKTVTGSLFTWASLGTVFGDAIFTRAQLLLPWRLGSVVFQNVLSRLPRPHNCHRGRCRNNAATRDDGRMSGGGKQPIIERFTQQWRAKWLEQPISSGLDNQRAQTAARAFCESVLSNSSFQETDFKR